MKLKKYSMRIASLFVVVTSLFLVSCNNEGADSKEDSLRLWFNQPALATQKDNPYVWANEKEWLKALPVGNGSLGGMVYGDVAKERIQLNEQTMWSGSVDDNDNPNAFEAQAKIRKLIYAGKYKEATDLTRKTQICKGVGSGPEGATHPYGSYQTLGDLWFDFDNKDEYSNYKRELDLKKALVKVGYTQDGVNYKREIFVSNPDQVMVVKLTADKPGSISFTATINRPERFTTEVEGDELVMHGALSNGKGGDGLKYMSRLTAKSNNGTVNFEGEKLIVKNADEVVLYLTASTDYVLDYPNYKGRDYVNITKNNLEKAKDLGFNTLLKNHIAEYQKYFNRVELDLNTGLDTVATDLRIEKFKKDNSDLHLTELLFQYGRYLLISSSRPNSVLPANLQGIWSNKIQTPWNGDFHTDVNVQMNYWPAEITNLSEMHLPLMRYIEGLAKPGSVTAKVHYHAKGWVTHPIGNAWGYTSPGEQSSWGMNVTGGAWIATHIMEHYYFSKDKAFLKEIYPTLKGSAEFYMNWLTKDPKTGKLVSGPSVSPENSFRAPDGSASQICIGPAHDQELIWQLFKNLIDASEALGINDEFVSSVKKAQKQLAQPKIGKDGRLLEWNEEFEELEPGHRHISHLLALHPGYQIDLHKTPKLAEAANKSLDYRISHGGGYTGWSAAWLINQYARLERGEKAQEVLDQFITKTLSPNMFSNHPPFQIDGNFGATAGIAEMLIQSQSGDIILLPAISKKWNEGEVKGLVARGGFVVDIKWSNNKLVSANIHSNNGGVCTIMYNEKSYTLDTKAGGDYIVKVSDFK